MAGSSMCRASEPNEETVVALLVDVGTEATMTVARDPKYVKAIVKQLQYVNAALRAKDGPAMAAALISSADSAFGTGAHASGSHSKGAQVAVFGISQFAKSVSLIKLAGNASPTRVVATIGITFAEKAVLATGLVAESDRAKCYNALASVVLSVGTTAVTGWTGIGGVLGIMTIAASSYEAMTACR